MTLITIIFKSFSSILLAIGVAAFVVFMLGAYLIVKLASGKKSFQPARIASGPKIYRRPEKVVVPDTLNDVSAISGEDPVATQLDLAKAYIESGKSQLARIILAAVIKNGNAVNQEEAQRLLGSI